MAVRQDAQPPLDIFAAASFGMVERVAEILDRQPELIEAAFGTFRGRGWPEPQQDWMTPLAFVVINGQANVVRLLLERGANAGSRDRAAVTR